MRNRLGRGLLALFLVLACVPAVTLAHVGGGAGLPYDFNAGVAQPPWYPNPRPAEFYADLHRAPLTPKGGPYPDYRALTLAAMQKQIQEILQQIQAHVADFQRTAPASAAKPDAKL